MKYVSPMMEVKEVETKDIVTLSDTVLPPDEF